jgi:muramoyltetrapeptide carboxypeptidase LdcA involved in peptidoglycan recycling
MVHLGRGGGLNPVSAGSLRAALLDGGDLDLKPASTFSEDEQDWADPSALTSFPAQRPGTGWAWHQPTGVATAPTWGGNLEILHWNLAASRWIRPPEDYAGCILLLETSEERPAAEEVFRMLRNFGERGLLAQFPAVVVARPKAATFGVPADLSERQRYRDDQRDAVLRALATYHPAAMVVFNVDFGHTDPQYVLPYGGSLTVDGPARRITAHY